MPAGEIHHRGNRIGADLTTSNDEEERDGGAPPDLPPLTPQGLKRHHHCPASYRRCLRLTNFGKMAKGLEPATQIAAQTIYDLVEFEANKYEKKVAKKTPKKKDKRAAEINKKAAVKKIRAALQLYFPNAVDAAAEDKK